MTQAQDIPSRLTGLPVIKSTNGVVGLYSRGLAVTAAGTICGIGFSTTGGRSTDRGKTWTAVSVPASGGSSGWNGLTYGGGRLVAVNNNYTAACYSANDGQSYSLSTLPGGIYNWYDACYDAVTGRFIAIGGAPGNRAAYSGDGGASWSAATMPATLNWYTCAAWGGRTLAAGYSSGSPITTYATSEDGGVTWTARTLPMALAVNRARIVRGRFCLVGVGTDGKGYLLISDNGLSDWRVYALPFVAADFDCGEGLWMFMSGGGNVPLALTTDLKRFEVLSGGGASDSATSLAFAAGRFVLLPPYNGTTTNVFSLGG